MDKNQIKITEDDLRYIYGDDYEFFRAKILPNCFCGKCYDGKHCVTIINYEIFINDLNDVVLRGFCATCGGKVGRYLEVREVEEYAGRVEKVKDINKQ